MEHRESMHLELFEAGKKAGIKEAVNWIIANGTCPECGMGIAFDIWKAKLKEWNIE